MTEKFFGKGIDVEQARRLNPEIGCAVLLYGIMLAQIIMSFVIFGSKNVDVMVLKDGQFQCPSGYMDIAACRGHAPEDVNNCVTPDLCHAVTLCAYSTRRLAEPGANETAFMERFGREDVLRHLAEETGPAPDWHLEKRELARRRLQYINKPPEDVWNFFGTYMYLPLVLFVCATILAIAWLVFLQKAAKVAIWGTIVFEVAFLIAIFVWYKVDFDVFNWGVLIAAACVILGVVLVRKSIGDSAVIMTWAMNGLSMNKRIFAACGMVQLGWFLYFALWMSSLIIMHLVKEPTMEYSVHCKLTTKSWLANPGTEIVWILCYYWITYFCRNINLIMITANIAGWYFEQQDYESFWLKALPWSVGLQAGGNALASAIMGAGEYLMNRIGSSWQLAFSLLMPWNWILVCIAFALKTMLQTFTKFGLIAMTFSGKGFCESAKHGIVLLKGKLGEAVVTDYLGARVMGWCSYMITLGVAFAAWAWADDLQGYMTFAHLDAMLLLVIIIAMAYILSYPFVTLVFVVMLESRLGSIWSLLGNSDELRARMNSIMASLLMGSVTMFILGAISQIVVNAMDVVFFCFAVEAESAQQQERFKELYASIKTSIIQGQVIGTGEGVVQGRPAAGAPIPEQRAVASNPPVVVVGSTLANNNNIP